jgi:hypothetical protein
MQITKNLDKDGESLEVRVGERDTHEIDALEYLMGIHGRPHECINKLIVLCLCIELFVFTRIDLDLSLINNCVDRVIHSIRPRHPLIYLQCVQISDNIVGLVDFAVE